MDMKKAIHIAKGALIVFYAALTAAVLVIVYTPVSNKMASLLVVSGQAERADLIAVLGSGVYRNGALSASATERVVRGVTLYRATGAGRLFFTGGVRIPMSSKLAHALVEAKIKQEGGQYTEAMAMMALATRLGVDEAKIGIDNSSQSTRENILAIKKYMNDNALKTCAVVTSTTHSYRAMLAARKAGLDCASAAVVDYTMYRNGGVDRLNLFYEVSWEYAGLALYWVKGYI